MNIHRASSSVATAADMQRLATAMENVCRLAELVQSPPRDAAEIRHWADAIARAAQSKDPASAAA
jgi:hypothetical protein